MSCTTDTLREKDVIDICNGQKIGRVSELEIDIDCGRVTALIVAPECFSSLVFSKNHVRVPWDKIVKMGKDTILVELPPSVPDKCSPCEDGNSCKKNKKWWML